MSVSDVLVRARIVVEKTNDTCRVLNLKLMLLNPSHETKSALTAAALHQEKAKDFFPNFIYVIVSDGEVCL